jgi:hypothetical protein
MDGGGRVLGAPIPLLLGGTFVTLYPLDLLGLCSCESWLLLHRPDPVSLVQQAASQAGPQPPDVVACWQQLYNQGVDEMRPFARRSVSLSDLSAWLGTLEGLAYSAWYCLGAHRRPHNDPRFTDPASSACFFRHHPDDSVLFSRARDLVSGLDHYASLDIPDDRPRFLRERKQTVQRQRHLDWHDIVHGLRSEGHLPKEIGTLTLHALNLVIKEPPGAGHHRDGVDGVKVGESTVVGADNRVRKRLIGPWEVGADVSQTPTGELSIKGPGAIKYAQAMKGMTQEQRVAYLAQLRAEGKVT